ncbi:2-hydroxychromene-2-carboxylate isomerase [Desertibaculum subflavum]|uniref:2-hydroxychromene-2-carboxylate isomerase n=1 Tax=Desertibaculum subflavum TaxID=2268458 RepID=UPI000E675C6E
MARTIDFYFSFVSPYSYLANSQLPAIAAKAGATIAYRPFRILELMQMVGNRPTTIECKAKGRYSGNDLARWSRRYGVPVVRNPQTAKIDWAELARGALLAADQGKARTYVDAVFAGMWVRQTDFTNRAAYAALLDEAGFDGARFVAQLGEGDLASRLDKATQDAAERGVFGAPTFFAGDEMFFGNDRLDFLAETLKAAA